MLTGILKKVVGDFAFPHKRSFGIFSAGRSSKKSEFLFSGLNGGKIATAMSPGREKKKANKSGFFISGFSERLVWNSTGVNFLISSQGRGGESRLV